TPRESERPLDHQYAVDHNAPDACSNAAFVGTSSVRIAGGPVNLIHNCGLRFVRRGRKGEVRVAAGVEEHLELGVDSAVPSIPPAVGEAPVAMDEPITDATVDISREKPVPGEQSQIPADIEIELRGVVAVVVKVQFDLAET